MLAWDSHHASSTKPTRQYFLLKYSGKSWKTLRFDDTERIRETPAPTPETVFEAPAKDTMDYLVTFLPLHLVGKLTAEFLSKPDLLMAFEVGERQSL